jgi:nicotinate-nucleotide adenylyltransferase
MRLGILGGTFDPIHEGHLAAGRTAATVLNLSHVLVVPAGNPWHRSNRSVASAEQRYEMAVAAVSEDALFTVSRIDIDREGNTYSIDMLREVRDLFPDAELFLIMGADSYAQFENWRNPTAIRDMAQMVVVTRVGQQLPSDQPVGGETEGGETEGGETEGGETEGGEPVGGEPVGGEPVRSGQQSGQLPADERITVVALRDFDISSTLIRERVRAGEPLTGLVPPAVAAYIERHHLYQ